MKALASALSGEKIGVEQIDVTDFETCVRAIHERGIAVVVGAQGDQTFADIGLWRLIGVDVPRILTAVSQELNMETLYIQWGPRAPERGLTHPPRKPRIPSPGPKPPFSCSHQRRINSSGGRWAKMRRASCRSSRPKTGIGTAEFAVPLRRLFASTRRTRSNSASSVRQFHHTI